uniref:Uncharacterized protein n=1 Tax=Anguilla anguilla TaxID=7936 RepID=A0A0E9SVF7_ANGAN
MTRVLEHCQTWLTVEHCFHIVPSPSGIMLRYHQ